MEAEKSKTPRQIDSECAIWQVKSLAQTERRTPLAVSCRRLSGVLLGALGLVVDCVSGTGMQHRPAGSDGSAARAVSVCVGPFIPNLGI